ncbi:flagella biosynthesis regulatory protein FliT [Yersinia massiliensis]|jgi:flagellar protein FliT|uniref:Flagellar protein FliT n=2 Tax=Yersinia TaxID=629 RepID=A0A2R4NNZ9_9GAMM|nr:MULTISPECIES: flagella biosynthesis regulatory protein FliT [Yersinia]CQR22993.1 flagellar biosynthesis protein FliT [Yersinia enterocolitica]ATM86291.1 flagella biosynthesis regulatory protein FliT [Yersinia frederiksenii]AVX37849.1 flagella biosynthesis regulatory protein FliT [Yersinia massiliensis]MCB5317263.1 flagella biosynthesis regulatory protein FliT [Yersinia massiliensis]MDA5546676.1 flagella biosynthesis regulatory protein FliT [Yersinia massiliensis]
MERHQHLLSEYQQILALSEQMLMLATEGNWDALVDLEMTYLKAVESTANITISSCTSQVLQDLLRDKLKAILDNEVEIKRLLQQRLDALSELVGQSTRQQVVNNTYGQFPDHALLLGETQ